MANWKGCIASPPKEAGSYFCALETSFPYAYVWKRCLRWAPDLYEVDSLDFPEKQGIPGWYWYDREYGYIEEDFAGVEPFWLDELPPLPDRDLRQKLERPNENERSQSE